VPQHGRKGTWKYPKHRINTNQPLKYLCVSLRLVQHRVSRPCVALTGLASHTASFKGFASAKLENALCSTTLISDQASCYTRQIVSCACQFRLFYVVMLLSGCSRRRVRKPLPLKRCTLIEICEYVSSYNSFGGGRASSDRVALSFSGCLLRQTSSTCAGHIPHLALAGPSRHLVLVP
jgi:hypothetical protein